MAFTGGIIWLLRLQQGYTGKALKQPCTAILRWSVEGFHSFRQSGEGLALIGLQTACSNSVKTELT